MRNGQSGIIVGLIAIVIGIILAATIIGVFTRHGFRNPEVPPLGDKIIDEAEKVRDLEEDQQHSSAKQGTVDEKGRFVERGCKIDGCSGQVCTESGNEVFTTCEYLPEYTCYQQSFARCEIQADNKCGWTQNFQLQQCLANPPQS